MAALAPQHCIKTARKSPIMKKTNNHDIVFVNSVNSLYFQASEELGTGRTVCEYRLDLDEPYLKAVFRISILLNPDPAKKIQSGAG